MSQEIGIDSGFRAGFNLDTEALEVMRKDPGWATDEVLRGTRVVASWRQVTCEDVVVIETEDPRLAELVAGLLNSRGRTPRRELDCAEQHVAMGRYVNTVERLSDPVAAYQFAAAVAAELRLAQREYGPLQSAHEAYAVLLEELDELWDEVKKRAPLKKRLRDELIQIAAMAWRAALDLGLCGAGSEAVAAQAGGAAGGGYV